MDEGGITPTKITEPGALPSRPSVEFQSGTLVGERYRVISLLGRGGMGVVYKVEQVFLHNQLALKTIDRRCISDVAVRRFENEAQAAFAVHHPNIIAVHDFGLLDNQTPFMVMDLVAGLTLAQKLKAEGPMSVEQAIPIFIQVCFGLLAAHDQGVVHRDIKPSNIMLVEGTTPGCEGSVKVVDFGIAKFTQHDGGEMQALTQTGEIFGSPWYMSPEQCRGSRVDHRCDVYSVGCVLFETLTGTAPFIGENALATMLYHQSETAPTLKEASLGVEFPPALEAIVAKMLAKAPEDRQRNLGLVAHDLAAVISGNKIHSLDPPPPTSVPAKAATNSTSVSLSIKALVALLALTGCLFCAGGYFLHIAFPPDSKPIAAPEEQSDIAEVIKTADTTVDQYVGRIHSKGDLELQRALSRQKGPELNVPSMLTIDANGMKEIGKKNGITVLRLTFCTIENKALSELERMKLSALVVAGSNFDDAGAECVSHWSSLPTLEADHCDLSDTSIIKLAGIKNLKKLEVSDTRMTRTGLAAIARASGLTELRMRKEKGISDADLASLTDSHLKQLDVEDNNIGDKAMKYLAKIHGLETVRLSKTLVSKEGILELAKNESLRTIGLANCPNIQAKDLQILRSRIGSRIKLD